MTWNSLPPGEPLGSRGIVKRGLYALDVFEQFGSKPPASSRLPSAIRLLRALNDEKADVHNSQTLARAASAQRTIWEFFVVAYIAELRGARAKQIFPKDKIDLALAGAEVESDDRNHLHRNTQFELYTTALLAAGGAEVRAGEPDVALVVGQKVYGVAAKRMRSLAAGKVKERMLEGARQIAASTGQGYLAVNVDAYFTGHGLSEIEEERHRLYSEKVALVQSVFLQHLGPMKHVRGVLIFGHLSTWDLTCAPPHNSTVYPTSYQLFNNDEERPDDYERETAFWTGYISRLGRQIAYLRSSEFKGP